MSNLLNPLHLPLYGVSLIEASAGTGKTYTLIILYIRLLLQLGKKSAFSRPLTTQEILVVTFNRTTTQSLRHKIKENIHKFRLDCIKGYSENNFFSKLLLQIDNIDIAIDQLIQAEKKMNQASIFTIHSFCQEILKRNTIDLNILFDTSIINNEEELYKQKCCDFWRKHVYTLPQNIISFIQEHWKDPFSLFKNISPYIYGDIPHFCYSDINTKKTNIVQYYTKIIININNIKKKWNKNKSDFISKITSYNLNKKIYNKKNLTNWINIINKWSNQSTTDHTIPSSLERFKFSKINVHKSFKEIYTHSIFHLIEKLYQQLVSLKTLIFEISINEIRQDLNYTRNLRSEITFNDLINILADCLHNKDKSKKLTDIIRTYYPVAIIDEFQDTDTKQYQIFHTLYFNHIKNGLILIGDPKQSIYSFRGADIFSYMKIRQSIHNKYNLNINWRSSPKMINAINQLFQYTSNPFIFDEIPFIPSVPSEEKYTHQLMINNVPQTAIHFWLCADNIISINDFKYIMAHKFADHLCGLINSIHNNTAWIENKNYKKILQVSDIIILVRNHQEASLMQSALSNINISSVFLSNRKNIFQTVESYELFLLLQAILLSKKNMINSALTTVFFNLNAIDIEKTYNNKLQWEQIIDKIYKYYLIWKKSGIYIMICRILFENKVPEKLLSIHQGENYLINILHLGELLQDASKQLQNQHELLHWLLLKIKNSNQNHHEHNQLLRLNNDQSLIKISTIHKSKGLEFPLTFLPFITDFNFNKNPIFHDRKSYLKHLNFNMSDIDLKLSNQERLSEDLRLLYVAITRSIYHCSIGIGPIIQNNKKNNKNSELHNSALGYLIQKKQSGNAKFLKECLINLSQQSNQDISFDYISKKINHSFVSKNIINQNLSVKKWKKIIQTSWTLSSYSSLKSTCTPISTFTDNAELSLFKKRIYSLPNNSLLTPHTFPKGKICGVFFHSIFENLDFKEYVNVKQLHMQIEKYNFNYNWTPIIQQWINNIIHTPLNKKNLSLSQITSIHKKTELKFCLSVNTHVTAEQLDDLCKYYDPISLKAPSLTFPTIHGMLQGFIDLMFFWNKKYYLLDYKTNWIGENNDAYSHISIEQEIIKHRYELQYQIYTLALHRFLKNRINSYSYENDFGGIYYLFIRGMDGTNLSNGIYFSRPSLTFIKKLDKLLS